MRYSCALLALALLFPLDCPAQANANKGEITGTVSTAGQDAIPGAIVTIRDIVTGLERSAPVNEAGRYRAVLLDSGTYRLTAAAKGFVPATVDGVQLTVGASAAVDFVLNAPPPAHSFPAGAAALNPVQPVVSASLSRPALLNLPSNGRRFQDFAVLMPTVQVEPLRGQLSFAGQRGVNSNILLDGVDYTQPFLGGIRGGERSNAIVTVPQSAIQEFQVLSTGPSVEYGRSTGGVLNAITRSGGNTFHGDAFYLLRHKDLASNDPVQFIPALETWQQYGAGVGGPLRRDKLFFFGAVERHDASRPRRVYFAQLANRPIPEAGREAYDFFLSEQRPFTQTNDALAATARLDQQTAQGHRLTLRYNFSHAAARNAVSAAGALDPATNRAFSNDGAERDRIHSGVAQYTRIASPGMVNDLRFAGSFEERPRLANSATPQVDARPIGYFGARTTLPASQHDRRYQVADTLSATRGAHTLKAGFDFSDLDASQLAGGNQFGSFTINSSNVDQILDILSRGGTVANRFDSGLVTYERQLGDRAASVSMRQLAAFAQDSWRLTHSLTLDFGLRWEGQFNPRIDASNTALTGRIRGFRFPNGATVDPALTRHNLNQFMPRLGFAWSPFSGARRTVVRGHAGVFYASTPLILFAGPAGSFRQSPGDLSLRLAPVGSLTVYRQLLAVGVDLNQSPLGQLPVIPVETVQRAAALALGAPADPFAGASLTAMANDFHNPRSAQAGLGVETELFRNFVAGAQLNYLNTVHLHRNRDYNLPAPFVRPTDLTERPTFGLRTLGVTRPIPTLGAVIVRESSARSLYRGLTASTQYRSRRLTFGAFYTWSETFSDDDSERDAATINYANPFNLAWDYGYARIDLRHQFTAYGLLTLPLGFELGLMARAHSGLPVNPITGADNNEELTVNDRPFSAPGVPLARNSFRNRKVIGNDLRVLKSFRLGASDARRLQFSVEFFNLLNLNNVVFAGATGGLSGGIYGNGIQAVAGQIVTLPVDPRFMRLRMPDGAYDRNNVQSGTPLQLQFGLRCFF